MWEKRKKEEQLALWIEAERERLSARAYALEDAFLRAFFAQCVESTAADAYEVFLETPLAYNYFRENLGPQPGAAVAPAAAAIIIAAAAQQKQDPDDVFVPTTKSTHNKIPP